MTLRWSTTKKASKRTQLIWHFDFIRTPFIIVCWQYLFGIIAIVIQPYKCIHCRQTNLCYCLLLPLSLSFGWHFFYLSLCHFCFILNLNLGQVIFFPGWNIHTQIFSRNGDYLIEWMMFMARQKRQLKISTSFSLCAKTSLTQLLSFSCDGDSKLKSAQNICFRISQQQLCMHHCRQFYRLPSVHASFHPSWQSN